MTLSGPSSRQTCLSFCNRARRARSSSGNPAEPQGKGQGSPQPLLFGQAEVHHRPGRLDGIPGRPAPVHHFGDQEHGAYDHHDRVLAVPIRVEEGVVAHVGVAVQVVGQVEVGDEGIGLGEAPGDRVVVAGVVKVQPRLVQALPGEQALKDGAYQGLFEKIIASY